ncbi:MAG: CrcB protein [Arcticibacterium sp.]|jgi:CrcB protein|tara:strand:+ start:675 stop:1058 length:384 start_codon:yes stop_codon:yes gene_type:complete
MEQIRTLFVLFIGGGLGTVLRYALSKLLNPLSDHFYWGTFSVNIIGSLILGIVIGFSYKNPILYSNTFYPFLAIGLCGGFTTFSTFALENQSLLKSGHFLEFGLYIASSLVMSILAIGLGLWMSKFA